MHTDVVGQLRDGLAVLLVLLPAQLGALSLGLLGCRLRGL